MSSKPWSCCGTTCPAAAGLVGYCRLRSGAPAPDREAWRHACEETLPDYMVPAELIPVDRFPLTANGKLDRARLPLRADDPAEAEETAGDRPRGEIETLIAQVWSDILGSVRISATDNFFRLGGHSLLAIKVVARLKRELGLSVPVTAVYEHPQLRALAAHIQTTTATPEGGEGRSGQHG